MFRYQLRTLLILLALGPPLLAVAASLRVNYAEPVTTSVVLVVDGQDEWLPWYPPGTPQASALCRQSAERRPSER